MVMSGDFGYRRGFGGAVFAEKAEHRGAFDVGKAGRAKGVEDRDRRNAGVHRFPEVNHHVARGAAAGEELGERRIDFPEVEFEEGGAETAGRFGDLEDQEASAGFEDAEVFGERGVERGDVTQRVAHGEEIEGVVGERQLFGAADDEAGGQFLAGDAEHTLAGVEAGDGVGGAEDFLRGGGDKAGAAGDIEKLVSAFEAVALERPAAVE